MIEPKALSLTGQDGKVRNFVLSKFPAMDGREIVAKYPVANIPKLGDYGVSEEVALKLLSHVGVETVPGQPPLMLTTRALVDNHCGDWEVVARLEWASLEYNCSFFGSGENSGSFANILEKAPEWISRILTDLLARSSQAVKQPSMN